MLRSETNPEARDCASISCKAESNAYPFVDVHSQSRVVTGKEVGMGAAVISADINLKPKAV